MARVQSLDSEVVGYIEKKHNVEKPFFAFLQELRPDGAVVLAMHSGETTIKEIGNETRRSAKPTEHVILSGQSLGSRLNRVKLGTPLEVEISAAVPTAQRKTFFPIQIWVHDKF